jgi:hypothetical protein
MHQIKHNKNNTIHGTYRSPNVTLKVLLENRPALAASLKHKIETFLEGSEGTLVFSFDDRVPNVLLKLERDADSYRVSLTKKMEVKKENMDGLVSMLSDMALACDSRPDDDPVPTSSNDLMGSQ